MRPFDCASVLASGLLILSLCACGGRRSSTRAPATSGGQAGSAAAPIATGQPIGPAQSTTAAPPQPPPAVGGTGVFSDASASLPTTASDDWAVAAGDVDQDGDLDLVIVVQQGLPRLLLNQGGGRFVPSPAAIPSLTMAATDAHLADLDQDGDLDLLVAGRYEPVRVFLNDGTGTFQTGGSYPASNSALTYRLAIGDVDQDGDLDVYMANSGQNTPTLGQDVLLLGDGQGGFSVAAGALPVVADDAIGVTFLDVEGDGDLDVCTANFTTPPKLLINDGQGVFTDETTLRLPSGVLAGGASCVVSADLNRDGFPDLFVGVERRSATSPTSVNRIYLNDGTGRFMDAPNLLPADADPNKVMTELLQYDLVPENMGGEIQCIPVSAISGEGLGNLEEAILLQAELLELKADPSRRAQGVIVE